MSAGFDGRSQWYFRVACCFVVAMFSGCATATSENIEGTPTPTLDIGDGGFLSGEPCDPPCFWGITPGMTRREEVTDALTGTEIFPLCEDYRSEQAQSEGLVCFPYVNISFEDGSDTVTSVGFKPSARITVGQVIEIYGEPDAVFVEFTGPSGQPWHTVLMLYYDDIHARLVLREQDSGIFQLVESVEVEDIVYFDTDSYAEIRRDYSSAWKGYSIYEPQEH